MSPETSPQKEPTFFQRLNKNIGLVINGVEVSILVVCVASLAVLLIANVFARTFH